MRRHISTSPAREDVRVVRQGESFRIEIDMFLAAPPARAWQVLTDFDHMAAFVPNLERSRIVERTGIGYAWNSRERPGSAPFDQFRLNAGDRTPAAHEIRARQISGTARR